MPYGCVKVYNTTDSGIQGNLTAICSECAEGFNLTA